MNLELMIRMELLYRTPFTDLGLVMNLHLPCSLEVDTGYVPVLPAM